MARLQPTERTEAVESSQIEIKEMFTWSAMNGNGSQFNLKSISWQELTMRSHFFSKNETASHTHRYHWFNQFKMKSNVIKCEAQSSWTKLIKVWNCCSLTLN